jgi:hypothetical protein
LCFCTVLTGCSSVKSILGFDHVGPDEFSVVPLAPLSIPKNVDAVQTSDKTTDAKSDSAKEAKKDTVSDEQKNKKVDNAASKAETTRKTDEASDSGKEPQIIVSHESDYKPKKAPEEPAQTKESKNNAVHTSSDSTKKLEASVEPPYKFLNLIEAKARVVSVANSQSKEVVPEVTPQANEQLPPSSEKTTKNSPEEQNEIPNEQSETHAKRVVKTVSETSHSKRKVRLKKLSHTRKTKTPPHTRKSQKRTLPPRVPPQKAEEESLQTLQAQLQCVNLEIKRRNQLAGSPPNSQRKRTKVRKRRGPLFFCKKRVISKRMKRKATRKHVRLASKPKIVNTSASN